MTDTENFEDSEMVSQESEDDIDADSDSDLQEALARGIIKPGLLRNETNIKPRKITTNNVKGLKRKLEEFRYEANWIERLDLINQPAPLAPEIAEKIELQKKSTSGNNDTSNNDFLRELEFYRQAQAAVLKGIPKLQKLGITTKRPTDYLAEMLKSDEHMLKVQTSLEKQKVETERREKVRQFRELKKFSKKVQAESRVAKASKKKELLEAVKKYRKGHRNDLGFLEDDGGGKQKKGNKKRKLEYNAAASATGSRQKSKGKIKRSQMKRQSKDTKYGQGGRKRGKKTNTRDSCSDLFGAARRKNKKSSNTNQRPGKAKRQKMKQSKKKC